MILFFRRINFTKINKTKNILKAIAILFIVEIVMSVIELMAILILSGKITAIYRDHPTEGSFQSLFGFSIFIHSLYIFLYSWQCYLAIKSIKALLHIYHTKQSLKPSSRDPKNPPPVNLYQNRSIHAHHQNQNIIPKQNDDFLEYNFESSNSRKSIFKEDEDFNFKDSPKNHSKKFKVNVPNPVFEEDVQNIYESKNMHQQANFEEVELEEFSRDKNFDQNDRMEETDEEKKENEDLLQLSYDQPETSKNNRIV